MANKQLTDFLTAENALDGQEYAYIAQGGKTRKTLLQKIKEFIIGTTTMGTTATDVTGAVAELNTKVEENTTQLNALTNTTNIKTYVGLSQLGLKEDTTLIEIIKAMPIRSTVLWDYKTSPTATDKAPDNSGYGMMEIIKLSITRVLLNYYAKDGCYYTATASVGSNDEHISIWRQATFVDSGWVNLTISEPYKVEGINPQFRKIGNRVNVVGRVVNVPIAGGKIFVFPAGYRPYKPRVINLATSIDNVVARCIVNEGGSVELAACSQITNNAMVYLNGIDFTID